MVREDSRSVPSRCPTHGDMDHAMHGLHILLLRKNKMELSDCRRALLNTLVLAAMTMSIAPALSQGCPQPLWPQDLCNSHANTFHASPRCRLFANVLQAAVIDCCWRPMTEALKLLALTRCWGNGFWPQHSQYKKKKKALKRKTKRRDKTKKKKRQN